MVIVDLSRLCDGCGKMIGGGFCFCPKCKICFCSICEFYLSKLLKDTESLTCPMCGRKLNVPNDNEALKELFAELNK